MTHPAETYFKTLHAVHATGGAVAETSYYPALATLLDEVGAKLKPRVRCVSQVKNTGAGSPDFGLYAANQFERAKDDAPMEGVLPERGVIEVKGAEDDSWVTAEGGQVTKYFGHYRQVLVTNYRDFVLVGHDAEGRQAKLETLRLAKSAAEFWIATGQPRKYAQEVGDRLVDFLRMAMLHTAPLATPQDVAWALAYYAREARSRIEGSDLPALASLKKALEEALGMTFSGEKGAHFFESTLIQTLFYGVFSAWVLWSKEHPPADRDSRFDWYHAGHYLRVPVMRKLFHEAADPYQLDALRIGEVIDWATAALNRVDRASFFEAFRQEHAVQYFYEPFLEAYDPELRKELGVWYTPPEIVEYMVRRVDRVLREDLGIDDGLADERVYVLDPCCGTGAYLVGVLDRIAETLREKGGDALLGHDLKQAAKGRVFGFEILPAPYVVSHLQLGLRMQEQGVPLQGNERMGVYLTNALTGWEPPEEPQSTLPFMELQEERDAAEKVKREAPILVILGNPPYNGFAGMAVDEERDLSTAYRTTDKAPAPQGQGLNDLYIRFFRMAERRIVGKTRKGVISFISNYSWLDGLSHTGMRERFVNEFDRIWVDCMNGDKYKTGKTTPDGAPDPSVFSTEFNREGIQVGTAIATLVRHEDHTQTDTIHFRHLWGKTKRQDLLDSADHDGVTPYEELTPVIELGAPFVPGLVSDGYIDWPKLPELLPVSFSGVQAKRDDVVIDIDRDRLVSRIQAYFDPNVSDAEIKQSIPRAMAKTSRFNPADTRKYLLKRGLKQEFFVRHLYRPFDVRWIYWEPETRLLGEKSPDYYPHVIEGNTWIVSQKKPRREWSLPQSATALGGLDVMDRCASYFPLTLYPEGGGENLFDQGRSDPEPNLSEKAKEYLSGLGYKKLDKGADAMFHHILAVLHSPRYRTENGGALRQDWPRVPLPDSKDALEASASLGRELAILLDPERPAPGISKGKLRSELKLLGILAKAENGSIDPGAGDLAVTAQWGYPGRGGITMPAKGTYRERDYTEAERAGMASIADGDRSEADIVAALGETCFDVYLNETVYWSCVPSRVWNYTLGGYQVIKKWLSYREKKLLDRDLTPDEARYITEVIRRIAAILLMEAALDRGYRED